MTGNYDFYKITKSSENIVVDKQKNMSFSALGIPEASSLLTYAEAQEIFTGIKTGIYQDTEVSQKLKILIEENKNYNSETTKIALQGIAPERTLVLQTNNRTPEQLAKKVTKYTKNII